MKSVVLFSFLCLLLSKVNAEQKPNILFAISDDQSWMHCSAYLDPHTRTPAFDSVAGKGVLFNYAYASAPSCAPSRSSILTGRNMWELKEAGNLLGHLRSEFIIYTHVLQKAGYELAATGKTWGPGVLKGYKDKNGKEDKSRKYTADGTEVLTGKAYNSHKLTKRYHGIDSTDYAANFAQFLKERDKSKPFHFWYGAKEPHVGYEHGSWKKEGKKRDQALVPGHLPQIDTIKEEFLDYSVEIEHFDIHLHKMIKMLEEENLLENTIIVVTSDHGNPMPRSKTNLYDSGTRVPLAISWPEIIHGNRKLDDFVNLIDLGPTFIELAGEKVPQEMTGKSLVPILKSKEQGLVDKNRDFTVTGFERHVMTRKNGVGYPTRSIRTHKYSYIRNYESARWPAGAPDFVSSNRDFFGDADISRTKVFLISKMLQRDVQPFFTRSFGRRPAEELYDMVKDPDQLVNLAEDKNYQQIKGQLAEKMNAYLKQTNDPRLNGESPWDDYRFVDGVIYQNPDWEEKGRTVK